VKAELNTAGTAESAAALETRIQQMLFDDEIKEAEHV
jgi:NitT/TauT family transport system ATP-binding protein